MWTLVFALAVSQPPKLPYVVVDTGQTRCFDIAGPIAPPAPGDAFYGQDAQYNGVQPAYHDNGDGTTTDLNTGLTWQTSPDYEHRMTLDEALAYADKLQLAGHDDWRLPSIKELYSIVDFRGNFFRHRPYLSQRAFDFEWPDESTGVRPIDAQVWSSTRYLGRTMAGDRSVFGYNFADGRIKAYPTQFGGRPEADGAHLFVRCVRGNPDYGRNDFHDNGDGTITDRATGLTWQQADAGSAMGWLDALTYAEGLKLAGHDDWRLPNAKELQSIVDYTRAPDADDEARRGPAIDPLFRLSDPEAWCWTSTTHEENLYGVYICFGRGTSAWQFGGGRMNAHGAGCQRSDPKSGDPADYAAGHGPQGDEIRVLNRVLCVRG
ncbi:MAG: DUF1566 domain-containing protein [Armatimonadetes bacterium]|nr:DUF1566 domain-containing protein [Armatimonadota bacterium]